MNTFGFVLLVCLVPSIRSQATCPCIEGGAWQFKGQNYLYCSNPNGARTNWCPTEDAVYDGGKFAWCEGAELLACQALKETEEADLPPTVCPCQQQWSHRGKLYNYCKTDTGCDAWCPVKEELVATLGANTTYCDEDILAACEAERDAQPAPTCPCVDGGQWTYKGKPQSYCSNPTNANRAPWCKDNDGQVQYCHGDIERACKALEGTEPVETEVCPCLSGGKWSLMESEMSYCQLGSCPKTHNVMNQNNWAKCGTKEKAACNMLETLETEEGKTALFGEYTDGSTGCACWFDLTRTDCACCTGNAETTMQCGAPMHNYCYKKFEGKQRGCPGVPASQYTLSTTGHPCVGNSSRTDCAWCAPGGGQCMDQDYGADSAHGNRCWNPQDEEYCGVTVASSCKLTHTCDSKAECEFDRKMGANLELSKCSCMTGWIGNGLQCFDEETFKESVELEGGSGSVDLTLVLENKVYTVGEESIPPSSTGAELLSAIDTLVAKGEQCSTDADCSGTFSHFASGGVSP